MEISKRGKNDDEKKVLLILITILLRHRIILVIFAITLIYAYIPTKLTIYTSSDPIRSDPIPIYDVIYRISMLQI